MGRPIAEVEPDRHRRPGRFPRLRADGPNQVWSWDISYLPTSVRGIWLYLYLVIDVWSRKVVAWDVAEREDPKIAAELVSRACLQGADLPNAAGKPLILHADNGNALAAGFSKSCAPPPSRPGWRSLGYSDPSPGQGSATTTHFRNPCFRTAKYRPDYPSRPFSSKEEACLWVTGFVDWYNHTHRHSGIRFVTPHERHSGQAVAICRHRAKVYDDARQRHPRRWSRSTRCWRQPEVVWINPPPPEKGARTATLPMAA